MIQTDCKGCGQKLKVPDDMAGKRTRCPSCGDPVKVPGASPAASSPERPRPVTPPPERPGPATPPPRRSTPPPVAQAALPTAGDPFDFANPAPLPVTPSRTPPAAVAQPAPVANAGLVFDEPALTSGSATLAPRRGGSLPRQLASWGALIGAALAVVLLVLLGPSDETISDALGRLARGKVTVDHIRGALLGLIGGLLIGCAVVAVAGRCLPAVVVACIFLIGGATAGAVRQAVEVELSAFLLLAAAFAGVIAGAGLGALLGVVLGLAHE